MDGGCCDRNVATGEGGAAENIINRFYTSHSFSICGILSTDRYNAAYYGKRKELNMEPKLVKAFVIKAEVDKPVFIGQDEKVGRRQLIEIKGGKLIGAALPFSGTVLPGGVDSQVVRPNGRAELSARYGVKLDDGRSFYIQNDGIRTVAPEYVHLVLSGGIAPAEAYYCCTKPEFEVYDESLSVLNNKLFICCATRLPDSIQLDYYMLELE